MMIKRGLWLGVVMLGIASLGIGGCGKREEPKPPPGVTKDMENEKLPTIDLGSLEGSSKTPDESQPSNAKTK